MQIATDPVQPLLERGEKVLWSGRPRQGLVFRPVEALLVPLSLLWAGFAMFWEYSVLHGSAPAFFALWGVPFVLIGLYVTVGRFVADSYYRSKLVYAVTDRRAMIIAKAFGERVSSFALPITGELRLDEFPSGLGTIYLGGSPNPLFYGRGNWGAWHAALGAPPSFFQIEKPKYVYELLRKTVKVAG